MDCETCFALLSPLIKAAPSPEQVRDSIVGVRNLFRLIPIVCQGYAFTFSALELSAWQLRCQATFCPAGPGDRGCPPSPTPTTSPLAVAWP